MTRGGGLDLLFATGGTGGHIYPALAVARAARERGLEVGFLGQAGGMEARLVPEAGFAFEGVPAGKWDRQRPDPWQALRAAAGTFGGVRAVLRSRPRLVVGFGGFASFPGCLGAAVSGTPLVLHEGNALPSRVTRWFAASARTVVLAQPEARRWLRRARATTVVPFPVREVLADRADARAGWGLPQRGPVTLVMGGSQGSMALNRAVPAAYRALPPGMQADLHVLHASGERWSEVTAGAVADLPRYRVVPYVDAARAFAAADLAITRAGVSTVSDAAFHGVPLLMVPLPSSAEDHQLHNARAVEAAGAGRLVEERDLENLPRVWAEMLEPSTLRSAAAAAAERSPRGAADAVVDVLVGFLGDRHTSAPPPPRRHDRHDDPHDGPHEDPHDDPPDDRRDGKAATRPTPDPTPHPAGDAPGGDPRGADA